MTGTTEDDWVQLAMADSLLVADLLLRLLPRSSPPQSSPAWFDWTTRGRRTRPAPSKTPAEPQEATASPSTPLSWSGATSVEETPRPSPGDDSYPGRSKASFSGERPRQKKLLRKSLFQLREEERLLLKERQSLKRELASLRLRVEEERAANESLKRLKVNSVAIERGGSLASQSHRRRRDAVGSNLKEVVKQPSSPWVEMRERVVLPDLNLPIEEQ